MDDCGELNPSEISNRQGVSRNTMSSFIRNLEEEGFVERRLDPHDRRRFNISLTDTGRALVSEHARHHLETIGQCFRVLKTEEQEMLHQLLTKVRERATAVRQ
jgi:DNA-binding MarR family transcriptional regulator